MNGNGCQKLCIVYLMTMARTFVVEASSHYKSGALGESAKSEEEGRMFGCAQNTSLQLAQLASQSHRVESCVVCMCKTWFHVFMQPLSL